MGWVPLADKSVPTLASIGGKPSESTSCLPSTKLIVNISGVRYELQKSVVDKYPNTLLGSNEKEFFYDPENNEYYLERDPEIFRSILTFYRSGKLHFPKNECITNFLNELDFFGISPDEMDGCCADDFTEKMNEHDEGLKDPLEDEHAKEAAAQANFSLRERLWYSFENPQTNTFALVIYYVTGFFYRDIGSGKYCGNYAL